MIKVFKTIFLFLLLLGFQPVKSDNWWHVKLISFLDTKIPGRQDRLQEYDYEIKNQHKDCNCTGINLNKSLIEVQNIELKTQKSKVNGKFIKLFKLIDDKRKIRITYSVLSVSCISILVNFSQSVIN